MCAFVRARACVYVCVCVWLVCDVLCVVYVCVGGGGA